VLLGNNPKTHVQLVHLLAVLPPRTMHVGWGATQMAQSCLRLV
jgi:hypothetical protein